MTYQLQTILVSGIIYIASTLNLNLRYRTLQAPCSLSSEPWEPIWFIIFLFPFVYVTCDIICATWRLYLEKQRMLTQPVHIFHAPNLFLWSRLSNICVHAILVISCSLLCVFILPVVSCLWNVLDFISNPGFLDFPRRDVATDKRKVDNSEWKVITFVVKFGQ